MDAPSIVRRRESFVCPWFKVVGKRVRPGGSQAEIEHFSVVQQDYVAVLAVTRAGLIPVVRQYRPAVEACTVEFPAGLLEAGEDPKRAACRELSEETGLRATEIVAVGSTFADTGRLSSRFHAFFAIVEGSCVATEEPGMEVLLCSIGEIRERILGNGFALQTHIGVLYSAATSPQVASLLDRIGMPGLLVR